MNRYHDAMEHCAPPPELEERLREALRARLGDGEVVHTSFSSAQRDGRLEVTLQAECTEEIGRFGPLESMTEENEAEP